MSGDEQEAWNSDPNEFDIEQLDFSGAGINDGRDHFAAQAEFILGGAQDRTIAGGGCNGCHENAGAMSSIITATNDNINVNTNVELGSDDIGIDVVGFALPLDEGASDVIPSGPNPNFEDAFNIQSIIEAPSKRAWFHNHRVIDDFEEAIAFYGSDDFVLNAPVFSSMDVLQFGTDNEGTRGFIDGDGIDHLGAFLRALNAYYYIRNCERLIHDAIQRIDDGVSTALPVNHCRFNLKSAVEVLKGIKLDPRPYDGVVADLKGFHKDIAKAAGMKNTAKLGDLAIDLALVRADIAVQPAP